MNGVDPTGMNPVVYRALELGSQAWKYVEPWLQTGTPGSPSPYNVGVQYAKKYGGEVWEGVKKAGKWYLDTVDKNIEKRKEERFGKRK